MSPGPHSAKASPGTASSVSRLASARLFSTFSPSSSSPSGFSGQGSALAMYSVTGRPQISAA